MKMSMEGMNFGPKKLATAFAALFSMSTAEAQNLSMEDMTAKAKKYEMTIAHEATAKGQKKIMNGLTAYSYMTPDSTDAMFVYGNGETGAPTEAYFLSKGGNFYYDANGDGKVDVKYSDHMTKTAKDKSARVEAFTKALLAANSGDEDLRTQMSLAGHAGNDFVLVDSRDELVKVYDSKQENPMSAETNDASNQSFKNAVQKIFTDLLEKGASENHAQ